MNIRTLGVLFDLDGVLVDSTPAVARCWASGRTSTASSLTKSCAALMVAQA